MTAPGAPIRTGGRTIEPEWRDLLDDAGEVGLRERVEDDRLVDAVEQFGPEFRPERVVHAAPDGRVVAGGRRRVDVGLVVGERHDGVDRSVEEPLGHAERHQGER